MGLGIKGQVYLSFKVDDTELPLAPTPGLQIFINHSCRQLLPVVKFSIPDLANLFAKKLPMNDGSLLSFVINDDNQAAAANSAGASNFRAFGTPHRRPAQQFMHYDAVGLLDAMPFIRGNPSQALSGHSTQVLQQIAQAVNLKYTGSLATNDHMTWRPGRKTWGTFAKFICLHGWASEQSALTTAVDEGRQLLHVDVNDLFANGKIAANIVYGGTNSLSSSIPTYHCTQYKAVNRSGMLNNWHGYGLRITQNNILNGGLNKLSSINAMTLNNVLDISQTVLKQMNGRARIDIPPMSTGNTHDNWIAAKHNNLRSLAVYSQNVYVLVPATTALNLFDMVQFDPGASGYSDQSTAGLYAITNMTRCIVNTRYYEKLELTNAGPNNGNNQLVS